MGRWHIITCCHYMFGALDQNKLFFIKMMSAADFFFAPVEPF